MKSKNYLARLKLTANGSRGADDNRLSEADNLDGVRGGRPVARGGEVAAGERGTADWATRGAVGGVTEEGVSSATPSDGGSALLAFSVAPLLSPIFLLLEFSFLNIVEEPAHETNEHTS